MTVKNDENIDSSVLSSGTRTERVNGVNKTFTVRLQYLSTGYCSILLTVNAFEDMVCDWIGESHYCYIQQ